MPTFLPWILASIFALLFICTVMAILIVRPSYLQLKRNYTQLIDQYSELTIDKADLLTITKMMINPHDVHALLIHLAIQVGEASAAVMWAQAEKNSVWIAGRQLHSKQAFEKFKDTQRLFAPYFHTLGHWKLYLVESCGSSEYRNHIYPSFPINLKLTKREQRIIREEK